MKSRSLIAILAVSALLKLVLLGWISTTDPARSFTHDSTTYNEPALAWVEAPSADPAAASATLRTPGYPAFLALIYQAAGTRPAAVLAVQILISLGTLGLLFHLVAQSWGEPAARWAGVWLALDLISLSHTLLLLTETLFTFLLAAMVVVLTSGQTNPRSQVRFWVAGSLLAVAILVRPIAYYLPLGVAGFLLWTTRTSSWRRALSAVGLFLLPTVLLVGGWQLRNLQLTGEPILCQVEGINLLFFRGAAIVARRDNISLAAARQRLSQDHDAELHPETRSLSPEQLSVRFAAQGWSLIRQHPWLFLQVEVQGMLQLLAAPGDGSLTRLLGFPVGIDGPLGDLLQLSPTAYWSRWGKRPLELLLFFWALVHLGTVYFGVGVGAWQRPPQAAATRARIVLASLIVVYLLVLSGGPEAGYRFRVPLMPWLIFLAVPGLVGLVNMVTSRAVQKDGTDV